MYLLIIRSLDWEGNGIYNGFTTVLERTYFISCEHQLSSQITSAKLCYYVFLVFSNLSFFHTFISKKGKGAWA